MIKKSVIYPPIPGLDDPKLKKWCEDITGIIRDLRQEIVLEQPVAMRYTKNDAQSISNAKWTKIEYDDIDYDTLDCYYENGFKAPYNGYYHVNASILSADTAWFGGQIYQSTLYKNGVVYSSGFREEFDANITKYAHSIISDDIYLLEDEYIQIYLYHNQGGFINTHNSGIYNYFSVHMI